MAEEPKYELVLTDLSKGLSVEDIQNAAFSMFTTPMMFPESACTAMTLEEFLLKGHDDLTES